MSISLCHVAQLQNFRAVLAYLHKKSVSFSSGYSPCYDTSTAVIYSFLSIPQARDR